MRPLGRSFGPGRVIKCLGLVQGRGAAFLHRGREGPGWTVTGTGRRSAGVHRPAARPLPRQGPTTPSRKRPDQGDGVELTHYYRLVLPTDANHHGTLYAG